jgi:hypothetical protein
VDQAPVVTASNQTLTHNQSIAASSLFTATDPDGQTITTYALKDLTGNGHFVVNGVVQGTNVEIDLTAAQLAQATYVAGSGSDQISIRASDGTLWSAWQTATLTAPVDQAPAPVTAPVDPATPTVAAPVDQAPVVTASNQTPTSNQIIVASWQFTATDANGGVLATYTLNEEAIGNGSFVMNEVVVQQTSAALPALDQAPVMHSSHNAAIALLAQYTAAGFQTGTDSGALVSSGQPGLKTSDPTLISLPSQKI